MGTKRKADISEDESVSDDIELSSHDEDDEFLIERILAQKTNEDAEDFYLIKWNGYPDDRSSWEPAENITGPETIKEWEDQLAAGDTLDKDEVQALEARMDESTRKRETLRKKKARQRSRMTQVSLPYTVMVKLTIPATQGSSSSRYGGPGQ
jgi:Chromo (CHRromatin Organisation MOdifier) domain